MPFDYTEFDIIIGPTADDRLFSTLDLYSDGILNTDEAIKLVNDIHYSEQIAIRKQAVIDSGKVKFISAKEIFGQERAVKLNEFRTDAKLASERTAQLIRQIKKR